MKAKQKWLQFKKPLRTILLEACKQLLAIRVRKCHFTFFAVRSRDSSSISSSQIIQCKSEMPLLYEVCELPMKEHSFPKKPSAMTIRFDKSAIVVSTHTHAVWIWMLLFPSFGQSMDTKESIYCTNITIVLVPCAAPFFYGWLTLWIIVRVMENLFFVISKNLIFHSTL